MQRTLFLSELFQIEKLSRILLDDINAADGNRIVIVCFFQFQLFSPFCGFRSIGDPCVGVFLKCSPTQGVHERGFFILLHFLVFDIPFMKHSARSMILARMAVSANGDQIVCSVGSAMLPIDDVMCLKDFVFFPTHLTGVFVSRKNKIPHIIISIALPMLIVHAFYFRIYHLRRIELPNLDVELGFWQQGRELVDPEERRVDSGLKAWRQPALWFPAIQESCFSMSSFSVSSASPEGCSRCQEVRDGLLNFGLVAEFDLAFGQNLFSRCDGDADEDCPFIHTDADRLCGLAGGIEKLYRKRFISYDLCFFLFE